MEKKKWKRGYFSEEKASFQGNLIYVFAVKPLKRNCDTNKRHSPCVSTHQSVCLQEWLADILIAQRSDSCKIHKLAISDHKCEYCVQSKLPDRELISDTSMLAVSAEPLLAWKTCTNINKHISRKKKAVHLNVNTFDADTTFNMLCTDACTSNSAFEHWKCV